MGTFKRYLLKSHQAIESIVSQNELVFVSLTANTFLANNCSHSQEKNTYPKPSPSLNKTPGQEHKGRVVSTNCLQYPLITQVWTCIVHNNTHLYQACPGVRKVKTYRCQDTSVMEQLSHYSRARCDMCMCLLTVYASSSPPILDLLKSDENYI